MCFKSLLFFLCCVNRSSYPDRKECEDASTEDDKLPDDKTLEYDDETLELTLPSGDHAAVSNPEHKAATRRKIKLLPWNERCKPKVFHFLLVFVYLLSKGAKIGHRSLMRYYKQRFGAQRAVALHHNQNAVGRVLRQYRALGWGGVGGKTQDAISDKQI